MKDNLNKKFNEDLDKLKSFITNVYNWLDVCYMGKNNDSVRWPKISVNDEKLGGFAELAWKEFEKDHPKESFLKKLEIWNNPGLKSHLKNHGLLGAQLEYKLQLIDYAVRQVPTANWMRKLIDLIDNLIGSFLGATGLMGRLTKSKMLYGFGYKGYY